MNLNGTTRTGKAGADAPPPDWKAVIAARRRGQDVPPEGPRTLFPEIAELLTRPASH